MPNAEEHLNAALKRAARVMPSTKLKNEAAKARNKASRKMDGDLLTAIYWSHAMYMRLACLQSRHVHVYGTAALNVRRASTACVV